MFRSLEDGIQGILATISCQNRLLALLKNCSRPDSFSIRRIYRRAEPLFDLNEITLMVRRSYHSAFLRCNFLSLRSENALKALLQVASRTEPP